MEDKRFKLMDLVKVTPASNLVSGIVRTPDEDAKLQFFSGAIGRVISRISGGYEVFFPLPGFPDKGTVFGTSSKNLTLFRGATQEDFLAAHFEQAETPILRPEALNGLPEA